jgi:DNA-3-methyladenine glycosylase II
MTGHSSETKHLAKVDPVMRRLIREVGPFALTPRVRRSPFESLARAIAFQQLHEKAADSILKRFIALFPGRPFPRPDELLAANTRAIRGAGFSRAKAVALRDLAAKTLDGTVPTSRVIQKLDDDAIVARLVEVRGIGRWTVEMLLIFQLGRPDVLPVDDFGVPPIGRRRDPDVVEQEFNSHLSSRNDPGGSYGDETTWEEGEHEGQEAIRSEARCDYAIRVGILGLENPPQRD